jgi:hypothetical protein
MSSASGDVRDGAQPRVLTAMVQPFFQELTSSNRVLLCGCGGGYDFFSALPLFLSLRESGLEVWLGNLTFTSFTDRVVADRISDCCVRVTADSSRNTTGWTPDTDVYFPELKMARFLKEEFDEDIPVYMFDRTGVVPLTEAYQKVCDLHQIDTVVVVDGGTDSLMFGWVNVRVSLRLALTVFHKSDEMGLGTPTEDMMTIGSVNALTKPVERTFLVCLGSFFSLPDTIALLTDIAGLGVDCFHGVSHHRFLENVSTLTRAGGFLGRLLEH